MLKKVFSLVSIATLFFVLAACNRGGDDDTVPNLTRGIWDGDTYVSEYLGLEFELPESWTKIEDDEKEEFLGIVFTEAMPEMGLEVPDEVIDAMEGGQFHDMFAMHPFEGTNIQILFERSPVAMLVSEEEYIEEMAEQIEDVGAVGIEVDEFEIVPGTTTIGNYEWHQLSATMSMPGVELNSNTFVSIQGANIRLIIITTTSVGSDTLDDVLSMFN